MLALFPPALQWVSSGLPPTRTVRGTAWGGSGSPSGPSTAGHGPCLPCPHPHCRRFESLREPLQERRAALQARSRLLEFFRDVEEEMAWVQEKLPLATSQDCGQSLSAVRHLQEKHQVWAPHPATQMEHKARSASGAGSSVPRGGFGGSLGSLLAIRTGKSSGANPWDCKASATTLGSPEESLPPPPQNLECEMSSREALTQAVVAAGRQLAQAGHLVAGGVAVRVQQLESAVGCLRAEATRRRLQLQQAREAQQFLTEVRRWRGAGGRGAGRAETR